MIPLLYSLFGHFLKSDEDFSDHDVLEKTIVVRMLNLLRMASFTESDHTEVKHACLVNRADIFLIRQFFSCLLDEIFV